jgi:hypothetical protein
MASIRLIKPDRQYAGLSQGWWLKNYWDHVYPRIVAAETEKMLRDPDESQSGPVMYAVGKYAHAFAEPEVVVKLEERTQIERYHMTYTIRRGFVLPFVKFIALESDGDGSSFDELRNVAQALALDSDVDITFEVTGGTLIEDGEKIESRQHIDIRNAMDYYCESHPIHLPPVYGQQGHKTRTNRAISSSFMAIFEPQEEGRYRIDVTSQYLFRFRGRSKDYGPLKDYYEIVVAPPIESTPGYRQSLSIPKGTKSSKQLQKRSVKV